MGHGLEQGRRFVITALFLCLVPFAASAPFAQPLAFAASVLSAPLGLPALLASSTAFAAPAPARDEGPARRDVSVQVLSRVRPRSLELSGPRRLTLLADQGTLRIDGAPVVQPLELPPGPWTVRIPGQLPRVYEASLSIRVERDVLRVVATFPLERYVAEVTASDTEVGTPPAALRAQAIVARSYTLAMERRHDHADACDLAHCQVLYGAGNTRHREAARRAVESTRGQVLRLAGGAVALAPFHGACGGHTADPVEVFGPPDRSGAAAAPDAGCPRVSWSVSLTPPDIARAAAEAMPDLDRPGGGGTAALQDLELVPGQGGYLVWVRDRRTGASGPGDRFVRALAAIAGWDRIRGNRLELRLAGARIEARGYGTGHGVGLCQAGAARLARGGWRHEAILRRYFGRSTLSSIAPEVRR